MINVNVNMKFHATSTCELYSIHAKWKCGLYSIHAKWKCGLGSKGYAVGTLYILVQILFSSLIVC